MSSSSSQLKNEPSSSSSSSSSSMVSPQFSVTILNNNSNTTTTTQQQQQRQQRQQQQQSNRIRNIINANTNANTNTNTNKASSSEMLLNYFWTTIDEIHFPTVSVPCIYRQVSLDNNNSNNNSNSNKKELIPYVCVRIIERSILTHFEHMNSTRIKAYGCLLSVPCTQDEVNLLNEINTKDFNFGVETFSARCDSMVKLSDFREFYRILIETCPVKATSTLYRRPLMTTTTTTTTPQQLTTFQLQPSTWPNLQVNSKKKHILFLIHSWGG